MSAIGARYDPAGRPVRNSATARRSAGLSAAPCRRMLNDASSLSMCSGDIARQRLRGWACAGSCPRDSPRSAACRPRPPMARPAAQRPEHGRNSPNNSSPECARAHTSPSLPPEERVNSAISATTNSQCVESLWSVLHFGPVCQSRDTHSIDRRLPEVLFHFHLDGGQIPRRRSPAAQRAAARSATARAFRPWCSESAAAHSLYAGRRSVVSRPRRPTPTPHLRRLERDRSSSGSSTR